MTSFSCCAWDANGNSYGGGANSSIYVFEAESRTCIKTIEAHKDGFICAMTFVENKLFTGGKDG